MDKYLDVYELPKPNQEYTKAPYKLLIDSEIETVIRKTDLKTLTQNDKNHL